VVALEGPRLDFGLGRRAAQLAQRAGVLERGDRAMAGERASVPAGELAGLERDRGEFAPRDAQRDAAADQARVERVVVAVDAQVRVGRDSRQEAAGDGGAPG